LLDATTSRSAPALPVLTLACRLGATIGAVGVALTLFRFLANRGLAPRLNDRFGQGSSDELDRPDRVIVTSDGHRDEIWVGIRVDDGDDRNAQLVRLADGDPLLLRVDDEHESGQARHVPDTVEILRKLLTLATEHELLFFRVVLELAARLGARFELLHAAH